MVAVAGELCACERVPQKMIAAPGATETAVAGVAEIAAGDPRGCSGGANNCRPPQQCAPLLCSAVLEPAYRRPLQA